MRHEPLLELSENIASMDGAPFGGKSFLCHSPFERIKAAIQLAAQVRTRRGIFDGINKVSCEDCDRLIGRPNSIQVQISLRLVKDLPGHLPVCFESHAHVALQMKIDEVAPPCRAGMRQRAPEFGIDAS